MDNVKEYVEGFVTFGAPVEYKGLVIKPILAEDAIRFLEYVDIFQIEKNRIPNPEIIQMTYLEIFINYIVFSNEVDSFIWLLEKILGIELDRFVKKFHFFSFF